jgi:hypothetical protein
VSELQSDSSTESGVELSKQQDHAKPYSNRLVFCCSVSELQSDSSTESGVELSKQQAMLNPILTGLFFVVQCLSCSQTQAQSLVLS